QLAIERLRWQLSCPPPPRLAGSYHPLNTAATAGRIATRPALSDFQPLPQTAAALSAIQIRCGLTRQSDALLPCPFLHAFSPTSLLKTFRTEGSWKASTRFAARNRKNRVNIGLSALRDESKQRPRPHLCDQDIESI